MVTMTVDQSYEGRYEKLGEDNTYEILQGS